MASIQRIMVVDARKELGSVVRTIMAMMDRQHILLEIPTVDSALTEISISSIDLLITAYKADGTTNGLDFARRAIREQAGLPIIVVADETDPLAEDLGSDLDGLPIEYVEFPPEDLLWRYIRVGLDGAEVVAAEEGVTASGLDLGPIPEIDLNAARTHLIATIRELSATGCVGGFISDRVGRVVIEEGATGYVDKAMIAATFGPDFAQAVKISPQIGGNGWSMKYFDGERYDLFALALGFHYFMAFIFDGTKRAAFGSVTRYGREGADKIMEAMGELAWAYQQPETRTRRAEPHPAKAEAQAPKVPETPEAAQAEETPVARSTLEDWTLEPVADLNEDAIDELFSDSGLDSSDDDLDFLSDDDDFLGLPGDQDSISFEDARNMGLLD